MRAKAAIAIVRAPFYSIRLPSAFQVSVSYPLPPPPTLVGALARCIAVASSIPTDTVGDSFVEACIEFVLERIRWVTVKPLSYIRRESYLLSRLRVLELGGRKRSVSDEVRRRVEKGERLTDAMVREYYGGRLALIYLLSDEQFAEEAAKALHLLDRLGDTESLVAVEKAFVADVAPVSDSAGAVDTYFPLRCAELDSLRGRFLLYDMHTLEFARKVKREVEDVKKVEPFILPLAEFARALLKPESVRVAPADGCELLRVEARGFEATLLVRG